MSGIALCLQHAVRSWKAARPGLDALLATLLLMLGVAGCSGGHHTHICFCFTSGTGTVVVVGNDGTVQRCDCTHPSHAAVRSSGEEDGAARGAKAGRLTADEAGFASGLAQAEVDEVEGRPEELSPPPFTAEWLGMVPWPEPVLSELSAADPHYVAAFMDAYARAYRFAYGEAYTEAFAAGYAAGRAADGSNGE